tara:strand:- start:452 stop:754 length:303 start_codon:yes stop_codon:yes gene_type:complete
MVTKEQVEHIAKLVRIDITPDETKKFQKEFSDILEKFEVISEVNVAKVVPMTHSVTALNATREDVAIPENSRVVRKLVSLFPDVSNHLLKVHAILTQKDV